MEESAKSSEGFIKNTSTAKENKKSHIKKNKPTSGKGFGQKKKLPTWAIVLIIIGIIAIAITACTMKSINASKELMESLQLDEDEVTKRELIKSVGATGTIVSVKQKEITSTLTGVKLSEIDVKVGDTVKEGDVIAKFDSSDIEENLSEAEEALSKANEKIALSKEEAAASLTDTERNADYTIDSTKDSVDSAYSGYKKTSDSYDKAVSDYNSCKSAQSTAQTEYDNALKAQSKAEATLKTAQTSYNSYKAVYEAEDDLADAKQEAQTAKTAYDEAACTYKLLYENADDSEEKTQMASQVSKLMTSMDQTQAAYEDAETALNLALTNCGVTKDAADKAKTDYESANKVLNEQKAIVSAKSQALEAAKQKTQAAESTVNELSNSKDTAKSSYDSSKKNYDNTVSNQQSAVSSAQNAYKQSTLNYDTTAEEKQVSNYEESLEDATLLAPFGGVVTAVNYDEGDTYSQGAIVTIQDCSEYQIEAVISEYDISDIELGQKVLFKTNATGDEELEGTVSFISPVKSTKTSKDGYTVKIDITTPNDRLRLDMEASISIIIEEHEDAVTVPYNAIWSDTDGNSFVKTYEEDGVTEKEIPVEIVMESNYYTEIKGDDIYEGMKVLLQNSDDELTLEDLMITSDF